MWMTRLLKAMRKYHQMQNGMAIGDLKGFLSWYYKGAFFTVRHTTWKCLLRDVRISPSLRNVLLAAKQSNEASTIVSAKTHAI